MVWVFSFCLYGSGDKYVLGMIENLKLIAKHFPDFETWIYLGSGVPDHILEKIQAFEKIQLIQMDLPDPELTCARFFPIDDPRVEGMLCRDADSRICPRDRWCIKKFMESPHKAHSIRDHYWHKLPFNAGMWGLKRGALTVPIQQQYLVWRESGLAVGQYEGDQNFLKVLHTQLKDDLLVHTSSVAFADESTVKIPKLNSDTGFIGQVYHYPNGKAEPQFTYSGSESGVKVSEHLWWLASQNQLDLAFIYVNDLRVENLTPENRREIGLTLLKLARTLKEGQAAMEWFQYCLVDEDLFAATSKIWSLYRKEGWKIVGCTDPTYTPESKELVIYYGNYHHDYKCMPQMKGKTAKVYRHPFYFQQIKHDFWIYHNSWEKVSVIYITNLRHREDRWMEILVELCRMGAPLNRVHHYICEKETVTGDKEVDIYLGASKNHLECAEHFQQNFPSNAYALVLEDDFTFTSDIAQNQSKLREVIDREYEFDVCLISSSKYHDFQPHDDLVNLSFQVCTTTSGYLLYSGTVDRVVRVFQEGFQMLLQTRQHWVYCCDRYWAKLQKDRKFFVMKDKLGYQRPNFSSITGQNQCHFD